MNQAEKQRLFIEALHKSEVAGATAAHELIFREAQRDARESILKAMESLLGKPLSAGANEATGAPVANHAAGTLKALADWCHLDPRHNRYDVGETEHSSGFRRWRITLWHKETGLPRDSDATRFNSRHTTIHGSSHRDCLAKGAQYCLLELSRLKSGK